MNKILGLFCAIILSISAFSQNYSYSFSGVMDINQISTYEKECMKFNQIKTVKIKYKPDSQKGEVIIVAKEPQRSENREGMVHFQPTDIKKFLISKGLTPMNFKELKK